MTVCKTEVSPYLAAATSAVVFFDRRYAVEKRTSGAWTTIVKFHNGRGIMSVADRHETEREAREYVGLPGGSMDPAYRPLFGAVNHEQAVVGGPGYREPIEVDGQRVMSRQALDVLAWRLIRDVAQGDDPITAGMAKTLIEAKEALA
jgi:hypothetical protein